MTHLPDPDLNRRIDALEEQLADLKGHVQELRSMLGGHDVPVEKSGQQPVTPTHPKKPTRKRSFSLGSGEEWINRIGIGLLLLGLVFLFKYSVDKGWLTPAVRVLFGSVLGVGLCAVGLRIRASRRLGLFLVGGGIAALYVTAFAAYQMYGLIPYAVAFAGMVVVTAMAYFLSVRQTTAVLAIIATAGGLGTPFLLFREGGSLTLLVMYLCLIMACASVLFLYRGWRSLIFVTFIGGWLGLIVGWAVADISIFSSDGDLNRMEQIVFQLGVLFAIVVLSVVPSWRVWLERSDPSRWSLPELGRLKGVPFFQEPAYLLVVVSPIVATALSSEVWDLSNTVWGTILVVFGVGYTAAYGLLRARGFTGLASAHGMAAAFLLGIGAWQIVQSNDVRIAMLAAEGCILIGIGRHFEDRGLRLAGHAVMAITVMALLDRLESPGGEPPLINVTALCDLAVIVLLFVTSLLVRRREVRILYALAAYLPFLGWFWRDLASIPNGHAIITSAWGLCAVVLLILSWRNGNDVVRIAGLGTLLVVVGKLLVVDLESLDAGWRVLLFLGFGGVLLAVSYFFPQLWRGEEDDPASDSNSESEETQ